MCGELSKPVLKNKHSLLKSHTHVKMHFKNQSAYSNVKIEKLLYKYHSKHF